MAKKRLPESVVGSYTALPHGVMDSAAFMGAGHVARSLLFDLMRQHNGKNNGHIQVTNAWHKKRGWNSVDTIASAKQELIERGLIVLTKQGGLNIGPSYYALTWMAVTNFVGLDIRPSNYQQGAWTQMDKEPLTKKRGTRSVPRNSTVPLRGTVGASTAPLHGTVIDVFGSSAIPVDGNNECIPIHPRKLPQVRKSPIVGKKGKSGIATVKKISQKFENVPARLTE